MIDTYASWLKRAILKLSEVTINSEAKIEAYSLLTWVTGKNTAQLLAFGETILSQAEQKKLNELLQRRLNHEPLAYILGEKEFWTLKLKVSTATLIPRADTEILVEQALKITENFHSLIKILDLGTGTGAIALALAQELGEKADILGVDFQIEAVKLAQSNAELNHINNAKFQLSNWFEHVQGKFQLIVSNPPYIDSHDPHLQNLYFEPLSALVAENHGLHDLELIIAQSPNYLQNAGWLLLEHGFEQGEAVRNLFKQNSSWQNIQTLRDYAGNERVTLAQFKF